MDKPILGMLLGDPAGVGPEIVAPMILSFVLAPLLESNMRKALITSQGSLSIFFTSPIACTFIIILFIIISFMIIRYFSRSSKTTMEGGK